MTSLLILSNQKCTSNVTLSVIKVAPRTRSLFVSYYRQIVRVLSDWSQSQGFSQSAWDLFSAFALQTSRRNPTLPMMISNQAWITFSPTGDDFAMRERQIFQRARAVTISHADR